MNFDKYPIKASDEDYLYEFYSEGKAGYIKKVVMYELIEKNLFNLGFGDWDENLRKLDYLSRTNNGDRDKVLATVAYTILDFTSQYSDAFVFLKGSTAGRTRLYQIGIANNLLELNKLLVIRGFFDERWEIFQKGKNYEAFLIKRK